MDYKIGKVNATTEVRCGPGTSKYGVIGSIYSDDEVYVYWKEDGYYFVEYPIGNGRYKCGYAPQSAFKNLSASEINYVTRTNPGTRYVKNYDVSTVYGYTSDHPIAGSVSYGEAVDYLGIKIQGYAFIEYAITGTNNRKRAFVYASYLATQDPTK